LTAKLPETLQDIERRLTAAGIESARADTRILIAYVLGVDRNRLIGLPDKALTKSQAQQLDAFVARRAKHEPVAMITGTKEFWSLPFRVTRDTLVPRPDSETLIEAVLEKCPDRTRDYRILDLGTGSGCLLLALLSEFLNASGLGLDANQGALDTAQRNADGLGLAGRAAFAWGDWTSNLDADRDGQFDIIVSNPPYITKPDWEKLEDDVRLYEPRTALVGGLDGLNPYRAFGPHLPDLLTEEGLFVCEIGAGQAGDVSEILAEAGLTVLGARRDLAGIERCLLATRAQQ
jgi:release factor glutamine methyltransferase